MIIIMLGAPASGKGTQSEVIAERMKIPHISTGDIFRDNMARKTDIGLKAKEYIDKGLLVPDELTVEILKDRILKADCANGFVLDGFPRTINQEKVLEKMLAESGKAVNLVLNLKVSDEEVVRRIGGRRMCTCGRTYHTIFNPPKKDNICDACGSELYIRKDDNVSVITTRLATYKQQTEPIVGIYEKKGVLVNIEGEAGQKAVTETIMARVNECAAKCVV
jgi:adenylate kinase